MGTIAELTVYHESEAQARAAIDAAFVELARIEAELSERMPGSAVSRLNREGFRRDVPVDKEVFELLRYASLLGSASGGAFDVTVGRVVALWGFPEGGRIPDAAKLALYSNRVGYKNLILRAETSSVGFVVDEIAVDLGAIAKGWAADRVVDLLKSRGVRNAIVDLGGDLRLLGSRPGGNGWRIGIKHPRDEGLLATLELRDTAIVTSGDYERFFVEGGVRYHHILDPATGQPARGCQSVTVLAPTGAEADACATAAFVLGPERGLAFLRSRAGVRGLIVDAAGGLHWTDAALERAALR
jgi:thiamine biosynthesis lipoprotein